MCHFQRNVALKGRLESGVLTSCRAFLLSARIPTKLELTFSYLEIHGVICHKPAQMAVETEKCSMSLKMASPEDVSDVLAHIGTCLRKIFPGLSPLDLIPIIAALEYNQWFTKLSSKDLKLSTDVCEQILRVVSRSNRLEELVLENAGLRTDFAQKLASALAHNPNSGLHTINLSGNPLEDRGVNSLCQSLSANPLTASTLTHLDLSGNALRGDDLSLRSAGAQVLEGCIAEIQNIISLDISDNGLESDLSTLIVWLSKNRSIQHLALGKNFNNMKSKNLTPVLDNLVQMIQDEDSPLQSLSLADSKLKAEVTIIINALGSNTSLTKVDISGNGMGDMGAKMLAKALQINTKLRTVIWDKNNITAQGFQDIAVAMEKNYTLRFMPIPMYDASQALKTNPEKTEEALQKIENYLLRNHETRKYLQEQAYRLQQGIVTSTTQQMIDRVCVKVQDHLNSLRSCGGDAIQEDLKVAERLMRDAKNSKTGLLESMVDAAENLCPNVMKKANIRQELIHASTEKISIPRTFVKNVLLEQSGIDILNKISEVKLTVASFLSDRIVDEILEALSNSHRKLADHFSRRGKSLTQREAVEVELAEEKPVKRATLTVEDLTEVERLEDLDTCMMTPKSKRKSIHSRMLRPVSRAFEMEFDLDKALEEVPIHIEDPPFPSIRQEKRSSGLISELPSEEGKRLEHFTKLRPKRNKKQQPTQAAICTTSIVPHDGEQNGLMGRVDEGVDEFFTKKVTKMDGKRSSTRCSDAHDLGEGDEKKKRDSRRSGFLNLIKSRSRTERPPTVLMPEEFSSPKGAIRSPPVDTTRKDIKAAEHNGAAERTEEMKTPESLEEGLSEEASRVERSDSRVERSDSRGSPQSGRRYVQVMGSGLLAEMKAKQERRAANAQKKIVNDAISQDSSSPVLSNTERSDAGGTVPKLHPGAPEARFGLGTPEKNAKAEPRVDGGYRSRSSSSVPTSPKPLLQSPKPSPGARPSIPQKPRTASRPEDTPDSPSGPSSPKVALLPPILKKVPSDKERDGQSSPQASPRTFSQEGRPRVCPVHWYLAIAGVSWKKSWEILLGDLAAVSTMDNARGQPQARLDAAGFWQIWQHFDKEEKGYIRETELDAFFDHLLSKSGTELASMFLSEDENFLLFFRLETPLDNSVEFMQNFLRDLFLHHKKAISEADLEEYTSTMMKIFDKNKDGRLDLNDLARILALQENFLLQFKMDASSTEERKRDFEKIFAHYDVSKTGALEGPEVDGFVKDMMELVQPSISGVDLDKFREILLRHCDVNKDGKIQKSELALCLGLKINP
ncbi:capping protein regulator and myosin 1 linker 1 [Cricetulus griseus]